MNAKKQNTRGDRAVTIGDVARLAGVSRSTVSKVMNGRPGVNEGTRRRVLAMVEELDFIPSATARNLSDRKTATIAIVVPVFVADFFSRFVASAEAFFSEHNLYTLVVAYRTTPVDAAMRLIKERRVDGVLLFHPHMTSEEADELQKHGTPVVVMNRCDPELGLSSVSFDSYRGVYDLTKHMLEHGFQRMALLAGPAYWDRDMALRRDAFRDAHVDLGRPLDSKLIIESTFGNATDEPAKALIEQCRETAWPDAVIAGTVEMVPALMDHTRIHSKEDVRKTAIAAFNDTMFAHFMGLTTVRIPVSEVAKRAAGIMMEYLSSETRPEAREEILPVEMIIRSSCGCVAPPRKERASEIFTLF